jgi:hypothetical protein
VRGYFDWLGWFTKWGVLAIVLAICPWLVLFQMGLAQTYLMRDRDEGILTDTEYTQLDTRYELMGWVCLGVWLLFVMADPIFIVWYGRQKSRTRSG